VRSVLIAVGIDEACRLRPRAGFDGVPFKVCLSLYSERTHSIVREHILYIVCVRVLVLMASLSRCVYPSIYLSICLSVCPSVCLSVCLSVYLHTPGLSRSHCYALAFALALALARALSRALSRARPRSLSRARAPALRPVSFLLLRSLFLTATVPAAGQVRKGISAGGGRVRGGGRRPRPDVAPFSPRLPLPKPAVIGKYFI